LFFRALEKAAEVLKSSQQGRQKTIIFITDEKLISDGSAEAANALRAEGAIIYAVGVGEGLNGAKAELAGIAGGKQQVFLKDFEHLNHEFGAELSKKVCGVAPRVKRFWSLLKFK
jgi:hypothetical protein